MKRITSTLSALVFLAAFAGCAYQEPAKDEPQATLHIITNLPHLSTAGWMLYGDAECQTDQAMLGAFSKLYAGDKRIQLRANEKRYLRVNASSNAGVGSPEECLKNTRETRCTKTDICTAEFEVVPVAGKVYRAELIGTGHQCEVRITDENTGEVQQDIRRIPLQSGCMSAKWKPKNQ